jgi:hypothetical protein
MRVIRLARKEVIIHIRPNRDDTDYVADWVWTWTIWFLLLVIGSSHLNAWVECGNAMCFHLESMAGARRKGSLVTSVLQKSIVCLRAEEKLTDRCIANILSAPRGQIMWKEKNERGSVSSRNRVYMGTHRLNLLKRFAFRKIRPLLVIVSHLLMPLIPGCSFKYPDSWLFWLKMNTTTIGFSWTIWKAWFRSNLDNWCELHRSPREEEDRRKLAIVWNDRIRSNLGAGRKLMQNAWGMANGKLWGDSVTKFDSSQSVSAVVKTVLMLTEMFTHSETGPGDFLSQEAVNNSFRSPQGILDQTDCTDRHERWTDFDMIQIRILSPKHKSYESIVEFGELINAPKQSARHICLCQADSEATPDPFTSLCRNVIQIDHLFSQRPSGQCE